MSFKTFRPLLHLFGILVAGAIAAAPASADEVGSESEAKALLCENTCNSGVACTTPCAASCLKSAHDENYSCAMTDCGSGSWGCKLPDQGGGGTGGTGGGGGGVDPGGGETGPLPTFCDGQVCTKLFVHTCHVKDAGTDSKIQMRLHSAVETSFPYLLDRKGRDDHERNKWFEGSYSDGPSGILNPKEFTFFHDGSGDYSGWCFDKVIVHLSGMCKKVGEWQHYEFTGTNWLDKSSRRLPLTLTKDCERR